MCRDERELGAAQTAAFAASALAGRPRVLAVGDGAATVARELSALGFTMHVVGAAAPEPHHGVLGGSDTIDAVRGTFEAAIVIGSVSIANDLNALIRRLHSLLRANGRLVIEDRSLVQPDVRTTAWARDLRAVIGAPLANRESSPWPDETIVNDENAIRAAVHRYFRARSVHRAEYLYRLLARGVAKERLTPALVATMRQHERLAIDAGTIRAAGLRLVADRRDNPPYCTASIGEGAFCELPAAHDGLHVWLGADGAKFEWG